MTRILRLAAAALLVVAGCEMPPEALPAAGSGEMVPPGLTLLWTGSISGALEPCNCPMRPLGGLARVAQLVADQRVVAPDLVLVDLGDVTGDPPVPDRNVDATLARRVRAELVVEALGEIGYDAIVPGERDLALGAERFRRWSDEAGIPLLSTNVAFAERGSPLGREEHRVETAGGSIVLVAVTAPLSDAELLGAAEGHGRPIEARDAATALSRAVARAEEEEALVVALAHGPTLWAEELAEAVPGIDVMIVSHDGDGPFQSPRVVGETFLLTTAQRGEVVGKLELERLEDDRLRLGGANLQVVDTLRSDRAVAAIVDTLPWRLNEAQARLDGASHGLPHPSGGQYVGYTDCGPCHPYQAESWLASGHPAAFQSLQRIRWQVEPECFACHATGFGYRTGFLTRELTPLLSSVGCEACHGPGDAETHESAGYGAVSEATCRSCHSAEVDPSFDFDAAYEAVRHDWRWPTISPPRP